MFPAHSFEADCLKIGITLADLERRTFVSIMKILLSFVSVKEETEESGIREATQADIDSFL